MKKVVLLIGIICIAACSQKRDVDFEIIKISNNFFYLDVVLKEGDFFNKRHPIIKENNKYYMILSDHCFTELDIKKEPQSIWWTMLFFDPNLKPGDSIIFNNYNLLNLTGDTVLQEGYFYNQKYVLKMNKIETKGKDSVFYFQQSFYDNGYRACPGNVFQAPVYRVLSPQAPVVNMSLNFMYSKSTNDFLFIGYQSTDTSTLPML